MYMFSIVTFADGGGGGLALFTGVGGGGNRDTRGGGGLQNDTPGDGQIMHVLHCSSKTNQPNYSWK